LLLIENHILINSSQIKKTNFSKSTWSKDVADILLNKICSTTLDKGFCNVMLTGGRAAKEIYACLSVDDRFLKLNNVNFYFGDERCVPEFDLQSNYKMVKDELFPNGLPGNCSIFPMRIISNNLDVLANEYDKTLPNKIDVLILSMGEDGHIASLFPHSSVLYENIKRVSSVMGNKPPFERLTITPPVLNSADNIYILAFGDEKLKMFERLEENVGDFYSIPARLVINGNWFLFE
jgi:6-phosphogluconolactonase